MSADPNVVTWPLALITLGMLVILVTLARSASTARACRHWGPTIGSGLAGLGLVVGLISAAIEGHTVRVAFTTVNLVLLGLIVFVVRRSRTSS